MFKTVGFFINVVMYYQLFEHIRIYVSFIIVQRSSVCFYFDKDTRLVDQEGDVAHGPLVY